MPPATTLRLEKNAIMNPSNRPSGLSRREVCASTGLVFASFFLGAGAPGRAVAGGKGDDIAKAVATTRFIDTHEHLVEEDRRTSWSKPVPRLPCNDWSLLFSHYLDSDLKVAGMPAADFAKFLSAETPLEQKWPLLAPHWPAVKNTGYGLAVRLALERLYGVSDLNPKTIPRVVDGYRRWVKPGFYETILRGHAGVESCQVNSLESPFMESRQPLLLMQDISILSFSAYSASNWTWMTDQDGAKASDLAGWHRVISHYFNKYGPYAVAVKTQVAYQRRLDFAEAPAEQAAEPFRKSLAKEPLSPAERKALDDHLFWYCVRQATQHGLPVKLHTGYYAGQNNMPMDRVGENPADVSALLRQAPDTRFVLMHIGYPFQEQMLALAKHYANAFVDMCWAWLINPAASERFVRDFLTTAPASKLLTFGGDYVPVEPVVGHAALARRGLTNALHRLVAEGWLSRTDAVELVEPIMQGNARRLFRLEEKQRRLRQAPWLTSSAS
jgi:predicted TIM-barrel fold metal-dependent hydrolase